MIDFPNIALVITALFYLALIVLIVFDWKDLREKRTKAAYVAFLFFLFIWTVLLVAFRNTEGAVLGRVTEFLYAIPTFIPTSFFFFTLFFLGLWGRKTINILVAVIFFFNILIFYLSFFPGAIIKNVSMPEQGENIIELGTFYPLFALYHLGNFTTSFTLIFREYRKTKNNILKKQLKYILFGIAISVYFALGTNVVLQIFQNNEWGWIGPEFTLAVVVTSFYASYRYQFLDVTLLFSKVINFLLSFITAFLGAYFIFEELLSFFNNSSRLFSSPTNTITAFVLSFFIGLLLFQGFQKFFEKYFGGAELQNFSRVLENLNRELSFLSSLNEVNKILQNTLKKKLKISSGEVVSLKSSRKFSVFKTYFLGNKRPIINNEIFLTLNKKNISKKLTESIEKQNCYLIFPLFESQKLIGLLCLGEKELRDPYTTEEIELLQNFTSTLSIIVKNISLYEDLSDWNTKLQKKVKEKTTHLRKQNQSIKELLQQQADFIAVTAHEFRTPLSVALFQLQDTIDSYEHQPDVEAEMTTLEGALNDLKNLTQKLFDVQKYDLNKVSFIPKKTNISIFVEKIFKEFQPLMKEKELSFSFENNLSEEKDIPLDGVHLKQVMGNLLNNAFKFTPKKGTITLSLDENNGGIKIGVTDTGKGIANEDKKRIFEKFQSKKDTKAMGIGLGLYICKKAIELHSGKIWVEDNLPHGAKFIIILPC